MVEKTIELTEEQMEELNKKKEGYRLATYSEYELMNS